MYCPLDTEGENDLDGLVGYPKSTPREEYSMDRKTHLLEAAEKDISDSLPGKEVNIQVTVPEELREGDGSSTPLLD